VERVRGIHGGDELCAGDGPIPFPHGANAIAGELLQHPAKRIVYPKTPRHALNVIAAPAAAQGGFDVARIEA
jgi:hypothetical protein